MKKRILSLLLILVLLVSLCPFAVAADEKQAAQKAWEYLAPEKASYGDEWFIIASAASESFTLGENYKTDYYNAIKSILDANDGGLDVNKNTEYERVIIALTALGYDASDIGGHNLLMWLSDYNKIVRQGVNSVSFALVALDCGGYEIPENPDAHTQNSRKLMVDNLLSRELATGGFAYYGKVADADVTAMTLQALAKYTYRADVKAAVERGVKVLSELQLADGGYNTLSNNVEGGTTESVAQVLIALAALGISPDDPRFTKGQSVVDALLEEQLPDGSFRHTKEDTTGDGKATVQALTALCMLERLEADGTPAYVFSDESDARFTDVVYHDARSEIEALAAVGIINGMTDTTFVPDATMTRAQFAAIVIRTLGLEEKKIDVFEDVKDGKWFAGVVGAAYEAGIIQGRSDTVFDPNGTITDVEAFIMLARAARAGGLDETDPEWYRSDYHITRGEVAVAVYELHRKLGSNSNNIADIV